MNKQFILDCSRVTIYLDDEWIPSSDHVEVWKRLIKIFGNNHAILASNYCTQIPLAKHYIQEISSLHINVDEHLLSSKDSHVIQIHKVSRTITVTKHFIQSYIKDNDYYEMDYCTLRIDYDPSTDTENNITWEYIINDMIKDRH